MPYIHPAELDRTLGECELHARIRELESEVTHQREVASAERQRAAALEDQARVAWARSAPGPAWHV